MAADADDDELWVYWLPLDPGPTSPVRFRTASGSWYDIDPGRQVIRRLYGEHPPTPRQGQDGTWQRYTHLSGPAVGFPVVVIWRYVDGIGKATTTNVVTDVQPLTLTDSPTTEID